MSSEVADPDFHLRRVRWARGTSTLRTHRLARDARDATSDMFARMGSPLEPDNPFERLATRTSPELVWVALHEPGLQELDADEQAVLDQLRTNPEDWGLLPLLVGAGSDDGGLPRLQAQVSDDRTMLLLDLVRGDTWRWHGGLLGLPGIQERMARELPATSHASALEVLSGHEAKAAVVVTRDPILLASRDGRLLRDVNLMTPSEVAVLAGVWARASGRGGAFAQYRCDTSLYHLTVANLLTPARRTAHGAWLMGGHLLPHGRRLQALASSIRARLDYLVGSLDRLAIIWLRDVSNSSLDALGVAFDDVVLRSWAVQDNLALLVGLYLEIALPNAADWSIHREKWRRAMRASGDVGSRVVDAVEPWRSVLMASEDLRHQAVHRESMEWTRPKARDDTGGRLVIEAPASGQMRERLLSAGRRPERWGLEKEFEAKTVRVSATHRGAVLDEYDRHDPGGAPLDPMPFASRLVATVAGTVNAALGALDIAGDDRLPDLVRRRASIPSDDPWSDPGIGWLLALTSPLSGLIPWARPGA